MNAIKIYFYEVGVEACFANGIGYLGAVPRMGEAVELRGEPPKYRVVDVVWKFPSEQFPYIDVILQKVR